MDTVARSVAVRTVPVRNLALRGDLVPDPAGGRVERRGVVAGPRRAGTRRRADEPVLEDVQAFRGGRGAPAPCDSWCRQPGAAGGSPTIRSSDHGADPGFYSG